MSQSRAVVPARHRRRRPDARTAAGIDALYSAALSYLGLTALAVTCFVAEILVRVEGTLSAYGEVA